jgi:uridine kinase
MTMICDFNQGLKTISILAKKCEEKLFIIISGPSCSGKSFLAERLVQLFPASLLPLDNYFRDKNDPNLPRDESNRIIFDQPDSYLTDLFIADVISLSVGDSILMPHYDKKTNSQLNSQTLLSSQDRNIVEGLFAISLLNNLSLRMIKVYLDIDQGICLERRIERDTRAFDISADKVREIYRLKVLPYIDRFILAQRNQADIIIEK